MTFTAQKYGDVLANIERDLAFLARKITPAKSAIIHKSAVEEKSALRTAFARASMPVRSYFSLYERVNGALPNSEMLHKADIARGDRDALREEFSHLRDRNQILNQLIFYLRASNMHAVVALMDRVESLSATEAHDVTLHVINYCRENDLHHITLALSPHEDGWSDGTREFSDLCRQYPEYPPYMLFGMNGTPDGIKPSVFRAIRNIAAYEVADTGMLNRLAEGLSLLFQTPDRLLQYMERWAQRGDAPLTALLSGIEKFPHGNDIDYAAWGSLMIAHGPDAAFCLEYAQRLPAPLKNERGDISLKLTRERIRNFCYARRDENPALAELCFELGLKEKNFNAALAINAVPRLEPDIQNTIPDLQIWGYMFGLKGANFRKLDDNDLRRLVIGGYTRCCEKAGDRFEDTILHAQRTRESGFYVIERDGKIIAHTWAWRSRRGDLVIDGFESADKAINDDVLATLLDAVLKEMQDPVYQPHGISRIILGKSRSNFNPHYGLSSLPAEDMAPLLHIQHEVEEEYRNGLQYPDTTIGNAYTQWLVGRVRYYPSYLLAGYPGLSKGMG